MATPHPTPTLLLAICQARVSAGTSRVDTFFNSLIRVIAWNPTKSLIWN
jgi:hypothetical protein